MLENLLKDLKQDIEKDLPLNIDLKELSSALLPHLIAEYKKTPEYIMQKHQEQLFNQYRRK